MLRCETCCRELADPSSIYRHREPQIVPTGQPMVRCDICCMELADDPSSLEDHRRIHNGAKPHKCPYCDDRWFIQRNNMVAHMKVDERRMRRQLR